MQATILERRNAAHVLQLCPITWRAASTACFEKLVYSFSAILCDGPMQSKMQQLEHVLTHMLRLAQSFNGGVGQQELAQAVFIFIINNLHALTHRFREGIMDWDNAGCMCGHIVLEKHPSSNLNVSQAA
jgi:hypothetical protein